MKFLSITIILYIAFNSFCVAQKTKSIEDVFAKVSAGEEPAMLYFEALQKIESKDKDYNLTLFLLSRAYTEKAEARDHLVAYSKTALYYDSAIYYLEKCKEAIQEVKFEKYIDYYLPLVNEYGIYDNAEQVKQDLLSHFKIELDKNRKSATIYTELANTFASVLQQYTQVVNLVESVRQEYPDRDDVLILSENEFSQELLELKNALQEFESLLSAHWQVVKQHQISKTFPIDAQTMKNYTSDVIAPQTFKDTGAYSNISDWLALLEKGRVEKLGDFWMEFYQTHQQLNANITNLKNGNSEVSLVDIPKPIYEKINFIDPASSVVAYLNYLEQKQHFLHKKSSGDVNGYQDLIQLYGFLQQGKLSISIFEDRQKENELSEKDALFFERLNLHKNDLLLFKNAEKEFLATEELVISKSLKQALVDDFLAGRFNPSFSKFGELLIPLYEQPADFLKDGQAVTTSVLKIEDGVSMISGTLKDKQVTPFIARVEKGKIVWLNKNILPVNALSFANNFDYYHCTALFKTEDGWGGVYYPGKFYKKDVEEKQGGLMVLFDELGKRKNLFPLPVMHRVDAACYDNGLGGFVLLIENEYLSGNYRESEILLLSKNGEVKWKRTLPVKSFDSKLNTGDNSVFLFANSIDKVPGEQHFKSGVHVFEINNEGVVIKDKPLVLNSSSYATQVMKNTEGNWLIFGFKGNNDLYNLRYKDVFFYMLNNGFDAISGGELTSTEKP